MPEMTYQKRSKQSSRAAANQEHRGSRVLKDNRAPFKQPTQLKPDQPAQRLEDEEEVQGKFQATQRLRDEEEPMQGKFEVAQSVKEEEEPSPRIAASTAPVQREEKSQKPNNTGLPDNLKSGIENLSGLSMDNVKVHYNSSQPAQLNALAYAQGSDIHVAPGQEQHLPHEAWHVVQQAQGRVKPTIQMKKGIQVNDDKGLEKEADVMGAKAIQTVAQKKETHVFNQGSTSQGSEHGIVQRVVNISVNKSMAQTLLDPGASVAKVYGWQSSFIIYVYNAPNETPQIRVVIYIATGADEQAFTAWNKSITSAWSNKFAIASQGKSYPITVEIVRPPSSGFKNYNVENVKQDVSHGVRGLFGTESMTKWGEADSQDIPHEVGHMLGNKDEYGTVDGEDWTAQYNALVPDTHSVMHKGDEPPRMRHFSLIFDEVQKKGVFVNPKLVKVGGVGHLPGMMPVKKMLSTPKVESKEAPSKVKKEVSKEVGLLIGSKPVSSVQSDMHLELGAQLHALRVKKITDHLMKNVDLLTIEQQDWLATHDWNNNWDFSAAAKKILNL